MSNLVKQYVDAVGSLRRLEPVFVRLPNGTVVSAVPEEIVVDGTPLMQLYVQIDGASGPIEAQVRMSHDTYEKSLIKAESLAPRLRQAAEQRLLLRSK